MGDEREVPEQLKFSHAEFVLDFADGTVKSTTLTDDEVRELIGTEREYTMQWWIRGAERKLAVHEFLATLAYGPAGSSVKKGRQRMFNYGSSWKLSWPAHETLHFSISYGRPHAI